MDEVEPAVEDIASALQPEHLELLIKLSKNVLGAPNEPKFRNLKLSNARIAAVFSDPPGQRGLQYLGWRPSELGDALVLDATADTTPLSKLLEVVEAGEPFTVTVMRGPLRNNLKLPFFARVAHVAYAAEQNDELGRMPRGRQLWLTGYPPRPVSDMSSSLRVLGVKALMLEDRWEQVVQDLRNLRVPFVQLRTALECPTLGRLALGDNLDFVTERFLAMLKGRTKEVAPTQEMLAARTCLRMIGRGQNLDTYVDRVAFCSEAAAAKLKRDRQPRQGGRHSFQGNAEIEALARAIGAVVDDEDEDEGEAPEARTLLMEVERSNIFKETVCQLQAVSSHDLRKLLEVRFKGEAAEDAGGLRREFFNEFGRSCAKPGGDKFWRLTPAGSLVPNAVRDLAALGIGEEEAAMVYRGCGRAFGLALTQSSRPPKQPLLLGLPLAHFFIRAVQADFPNTTTELQTELNEEQRADSPDFRGSARFLECPLAEVGLDGGQLTMPAPANCRGDSAASANSTGVQVVQVTDANKAEWLHQTLQNDLFEDTSKASENFRLGVCDAVGASHLLLLTAAELRGVWSGRGSVTDEDLVHWRSCTQVSPAVEKQAEWFFELLRGELRDARPRILKFATGSDRWPLDASGFTFVIEPRDGGDNALPSAMTCGNMLQLPRYSRSELVRDRLVQVIDLGSDLHLA